MRKVIQGPWNQYDAFKHMACTVFKNDRGEFWICADIEHDNDFDEMMLHASVAIGDSASCLYRGRLPYCMVSDPLLEYDIPPDDFTAKLGEVTIPF